LNNYRRALALGLLVLVLAVVVVPLANVSVVLKSARAQQGSGQVYSNFTVSWTGNLTVYLYGVSPSSKVLLWWGIEPYPQGPWYTTSGKPGNMETPMTYNSTLKAFVATIGPFKNGTWVAYVFKDSTRGTSENTQRYYGYQTPSDSTKQYHK